MKDSDLKPCKVCGCKPVECTYDGYEGMKCPKCYNFHTGNKVILRVTKELAIEDWNEWNTFTRPSDDSNIDPNSYNYMSGFKDGRKSENPSIYDVHKKSDECFCKKLFPGNAIVVNNLTECLCVKCGGKVKIVDEPNKDPWISANSFDDVKDNISKIVKYESKCEHEGYELEKLICKKCGNAITKTSHTTSEHKPCGVCGCNACMCENSTTSEVERLANIFNNWMDKNRDVNDGKTLAEITINAGYRLHPEKRELDEKELSDFIYQAPLAHDLLAKAICLRFSAPRVEITKERIEHIIHRMTSWHSKDNYFFGIPYNKECPYCNDNLWLNNIAKAIKEELEKEK